MLVRSLKLVGEKFERSLRKTLTKFLEKSLISSMRILTQTLKKFQEIWMNFTEWVSRDTNLNSLLSSSIFLSFQTSFIPERDLNMKENYFEKFYRHLNRDNASMLLENRERCGGAELMLTYKYIFNSPIDCFLTSMYAEVITQSLLLHLFSNTNLNRQLDFASEFHTRYHTKR